MQAMVTALQLATPNLREVATWLDLSYAAVRSYATGARRPSPTTARHCARVLRRHARRLEQAAARLDTAADRGTT